jgi:hypothetical protein
MNGKRSLVGMIAVLVLAAGALGQTAVQPSFTYQGQLKFAGNPASGTYDLSFTLWDNAGSGSPPVGGNQIGLPVSKPGVAIADGLFTVVLNEAGEFGATAFTGEARWLQVAVSGSPLSPRQPVTATPFAIYALNGPGMTGLWAANGVAIYNTNAGSVGIGDDNPLAFLHVGPEHLALGPADLHSEDVIIAGGDGVLGIYSDAAGGAGNGSAIALGEIGASLTDKWGIFLDTNAAGSDLHFSYGTNADFALNESILTLDATDRNVGIGTSSPAARLHVNGDVRADGRAAFGNAAIFGADILWERIFDFSHRITDVSTTAAFWNAFHSRIEYDPTTDPTTTLLGYRFDTGVPPTNARTFGSLLGLDIACDYTGTGSVNTLRAAAIFASGTGIVNQQRGLVLASDGRGDAVITDNRALDIWSGHRSAGGGITDDYGIYVHFPSRNSPLTNHYGIYMQSQGDPVSFPTSYAIYADGGQSYFRDAVGIGTSTPTQLLDVAGRIRVQQNTPPTSSNTAGMWLYQQTPAADRAFIGMRNDDQVGLYGTTGAGWGMVMNVDDGNVGIGTAVASVPLHVDGGGDIGLGGGGFLVAGNVASLNVGMDNNEIMARNAGAAADFFINHDGGNILMSAGGGVGNVGIGTTSPTLAKVQISVANQRCIYGTNNSATLASAFFDNTGTGPAGVFDGNVTVAGALSKSSGSFRIDHPLDPANKYLYHSFVESPDMMNVYNGNAVTDERGYATITMPDWFETLNRDFRYQLTVIDDADSEQFVQAKVVGKLRDNRFTIRSSVPAVEVSWQITGIRQDPWAEAHRVPVEEDKPAHEHGKYQHPELYGQPTEMSVFRVQAAELDPASSDDASDRE